MKKYFILLIILLILSGCKAAKISTIALKGELDKQAELEKQQLFQKAITEQNPELCPKLSTLEQISCITKIAFDKKDVLTCDFIESGAVSYKKFCQIITEGDVNNCNKLENKPEENVKVYACKAIIKNDKSICSNMSQVSKNICLIFYLKF